MPLILQVLNSMVLFVFLSVVCWNTSEISARIEAVRFQHQQTESTLLRAIDHQSLRVSEVAGIIRSPAFCNPNYLSQTKTVIQSGTNKIEVPGPGGIISAGSTFNVRTEDKQR